MLHRFSREVLLIGAQGLEKLQRARVAVFGIGGVGGYVVEALARSGVGALDLFDGDTVALTNINRQIIALESTVGRPKVEVARERVLQINPAFRVAPLEKTSVCPLARVMRRELKKRGITGVKAVYSTEEALTPQAAQAGDTKGTAGRPTPGSMAFVPSVAGLILAGEIVRDLLDGTQQ